MAPRRRVHHIELLNQLATLAAKAGRSSLTTELNVAEIGVDRADTSVVLLEWFPNLVMRLVDVWGRYDPLGRYAKTGEPRARRNADKWNRIYESVVRRTAFAADRAILMRMSSVEAAALVPDCSLDLVFIDAEHSRDAVLEDIRVWMPKIRDGGVMGGHDIDDPRFPGVRQAVEETGRKFRVGLGNTWWFSDGPR